MPDDERYRTKLEEAKLRAKARLDEAAERNRASIEKTQITAQSRMDLAEFRRDERDARQEQRAVTQVDAAQVRGEMSVELEKIRHRMKEISREPDFQDFVRRAEVDFDFRRREMMLGMERDRHNLALRLQEMRQNASSDMFRLCLSEIFSFYREKNNHAQHLEVINTTHHLEQQHAENAHRHRVAETYHAAKAEIAKDTNRMNLEDRNAAHTSQRLIGQMREQSGLDEHKARYDHSHRLSEIDANADADAYRNEQGIRRDNNSSRLRIEESFENKLMDLLFSRYGGANDAARGDIENIIALWEKESERLKR